MQSWSWDGKLFGIAADGAGPVLFALWEWQGGPTLTGGAYMVTSLSGTPVSFEEQDQSQEGTSIPEGSLCYSSNLLTMLSYQLRL